MTRREKRLARLWANPRQVRFSDLRSVLEDHGFSVRPGAGDHWVFTHPRLAYPVTVDPRRPFVLPVYVRIGLRAIDELQTRLEAGGD